MSRSGGFLGAVLATFALVATACAVGERPVLLEEGTGGSSAGAIGGLADDTPAPTLDGAPEGVPEVAPPAVTDEVSTQRVLSAGPPVVVSPTGIVSLVSGVDETGAFVVTTPCGNTQRITWGQPVRTAEVVIDPGHGGDEPGAIGPSGETEAELNLDVARRAAALLEAEGITAALTRNADYRVPIRARAELADALGASMLISIHHNSPTPDGRSADGPGAEVYIQGASADSARLGGLLHAEIVDSLSVFDADWATASNAGVLKVVNDEGGDAYGINRYPTTVSVLAEFAYLSNPSEATVLATDDYRQRAAEAVVAAVVRYRSGDAGGTAVNPEPRLFTSAGGTGGLEGCVDPVLA